MSTHSQDDVLLIKIENMAQTCGRIETNVIAINGRIRNLEKWRSWITGGLSGLAFAIGILAYFIKN